MSRSVWGFGKVVGVLIMVVGLSGIPGDLAQWASWIRGMTAEQWRWALLGLGLAAAVGSSLPDLRRWFGGRQASSDAATAPPAGAGPPCGGRRAPGRGRRSCRRGR